MKITHIVAAIVISGMITAPVLADSADGSHGADFFLPEGGSNEVMPMMQGQGGAMANQQRMQNMMTINKQKMLMMETRLTNIEALIRELVELKKTM